MVVGGASAGWNNDSLSSFVVGDWDWDCGCDCWSLVVRAQRRALPLVVTCVQPVVASVIWSRFCACKVLLG